MAVLLLEELRNLTNRDTIPFMETVQKTPPHDSRAKPAPSRIPLVDSVWTFVFATALLGPFALPLLWRNPRWSRHTKIGTSVAVVLLTVFLFFVAGSYLNRVLTEYRELMEALQPNP